MFFWQQRQGFLQELHHPAGGATVAAAQPAVQQKMRFGQLCHQRMMRRPAVLARVGSAQGTLLVTVALEHRGIQIQAVSRGAFWQSFKLPVPQTREKTLTLSLPEALEQVANRVVDRKTGDSQQRLQGGVSAQQTGVREAPRSRYHGKQKRCESLYRIDGVGGRERERQMLPHRFAIADPPQKFAEHHQATERSHRPLGLAQFHFLPAPKSGNFPVHWFVLLGVSLNQLKHYRVRVEQCYLISGFRLKSVQAMAGSALHFRNWIGSSRS